ncbi:hypothetical protein RRG08_052872 [Elysia crispata]|uniref:Uncharacterized protein n=1 Tax=Elysia crispata TaxID=231223 RepID=A0AAE1A8S6_9GAST|nr:hypothetical protein RRG08_052872 [Elysia crispata]
MVLIVLLLLLCFVTQAEPACSPVEEVTACDKLEIYALPESPSCTVSEDTESGDIKSVNVSCSTSKVYPKARCRFYNATDRASRYEHLTYSGDESMLYTHGTSRSITRLTHSVRYKSRIWPPALPGIVDAGTSFCPVAVNAPPLRSRYRVRYKPRILCRAQSYGTSVLCPGRSRCNTALCHANFHGMVAVPPNLMLRIEFAESHIKRHRQISPPGVSASKAQEGFLSNTSMST